MTFPAAVSSFSGIRSRLQQFDRSCNSLPSYKYGEFKEDWRVLKMLSESIHMLSIADPADLDGGEYLCLLALKIDAAVEEIANDLEAVETRIKIKNQQDSITEILLEFIRCYGAKIKRVMAEIGEALDLYLSSSGAICCSWSFLACSPPCPQVSLLLSFAESVKKLLFDLAMLFPGFSGGSSTGKHIDVLEAKRSNISVYISDLDLSSSPGGGDDDDKSWRSIVDGFLSHFASVLVNLAIQTCNYPIHYERTITTDSPSPIGFLKDSHHQIDPTNPRFMELHVNFLLALNKIPGYQVDFVNIFFRYLIGDRVRYAHISDVSSLIISFLDSSKIDEEDVAKSLSQEITAMLLEIATLFEVPGANGGPGNKPSELPTKICLVKAELCLRKQIQKISSSSNCKGLTSYHVISGCRLEIDYHFYHIRENLRTYSNCVPLEKLEYGKKTLDLVEQIHEESLSLISSIQLKHITEEYKVKNSLLLLLLKIVLFKAESFLTELSLLNKKSSSGAATTVIDYGGKDQISFLLQLLKFFKQILSDQKLKDREDVYMPFLQIEICARGMACFSYNFHPSKITEDVIRKMFLSACEVLHKVKHLDSSANKIGHQFPFFKVTQDLQTGLP